MTKFKDFFDNNKLNIRDLAYNSGVTEASVYGWLSGRRKPEIKSLLKLKDYLKENNIEVNVLDLFN